jgi:hypothetical protein
MGLRLYQRTQIFIKGLGPLAIGLLVSRGWKIGDTFAALGMPALCGALFTSLIAINRHRGAAAADRVKDTG